MPKFNKPKVNQPKVNKSKLDDRPDQSKSLPSQSELPPVQLDETIVAGRRPKPLNDIQRLLAEVPELSSGFDPEMFAHLPENIPFNLKQFESKIQKILGSKNIDVSLENSVKYLEYIKQNIQLPCHVTGIQEFEWEEEYTMGSGSKKEYASSKKLNLLILIASPLIAWRILLFRKKAYLSKCSASASAKSLCCLYPS
jgi:hypothetical protein